MINEAEAYELAARMTRCVEKALEPHKLQQLLDSIARGLMGELAAANEIIEHYRSWYGVDPGPFVKPKFEDYEGL